MADRPILFSAPMVRALLAGRKTQTRRVLSPRNTYRDGSPWPKHAPWDAHDWNDAFVDPGPSPAGNPGPYLKVAYPDDGTRHRIYPLCWPGDRLWVREACRSVEAEGTFERHVQYRADDEFSASLAPPEDNSSEAFGRWWTVLAYRSDDPDLTGGQWLPSIHMPRWASRLTLTVTNVRIQRLHEINEEEARLEGTGSWARWIYSKPEVTADTIDAMTKESGEPPGSLRTGFACLWNSINGAGAWQSNPWVMALTFSVERVNVDG